MNDIYKQKAKKYKYKYLKLKKEYLGEGGGYLGQGAYGCIISPPIKFDHIKLLKNNSDITDFYNNSDYIGKLLNCNIYKHNKSDLSMNIFEEEYNSFNNLDNIDPEAQYRSKLIYAAIISKDKLDNDQIDEKTKECIQKVINIPGFVDFNVSTDENYNNKNFGYIVSTKVGKSFDKIQFNNFDKQKIINFLTALKNSINFIKILYRKEYIHADIKLLNMTYKEDLEKVYFIDFGLLHNYKENDDMIKQKSHYEIYPYILFLFFKVEKRNNNNNDNIKTITKSKLIEEIKEEINKNQINKNYNKRIFEITKVKDIDQYIRQFFELLSDNVVDGEKEKHNFFYIYFLCIVPIIKNIDIYLLSFVIYQLFFPFYGTYTFHNKYINNNTKEIIHTLLKDALYNNIDGPDELIIYLEKIIDSINSTKIIELQQKQPLQIQQQQSVPVPGKRIVFRPRQHINPGQQQQLLRQHYYPRQQQLGQHINPGPGQVIGRQHIIPRQQQQYDQLQQIKQYGPQPIRTYPLAPADAYGFRQPR
jgi:serine/threonine protein kinase